MTEERDMLIACRLSDQISDRQWQQHLADDPEMAPVEQTERSMPLITLAEHHVLMAAMAEEFRSVNVAKVLEQFPELPGMRDKIEELRTALAKAETALSSLSEAVLNDNGDITVSLPTITREECIRAYHASRRIRDALEAKP